MSSGRVAGEDEHLVDARRRASRAVRTASPVPSGRSCTATVRPVNASAVSGDATTTSGVGAERPCGLDAPSRPCAGRAAGGGASARPTACACRALLPSRRLRVSSVSRVDLAGAPGFEPGITGPKPVALPLGHAPSKRDAECSRPGCRQSPPAYASGRATDRCEIHVASTSSDQARGDGARRVAGSRRGRRRPAPRRDTSARKAPVLEAVGERRGGQVVAREQRQIGADGGRRRARSASAPALVEAVRARPLVEGRVDVRRRLLRRTVRAAPGARRSPGAGRAASGRPVAAAELRTVREEERDVGAESRGDRVESGRLERPRRAARSRGGARSRRRSCHRRVPRRPGSAF